MTDSNTIYNCHNAQAFLYKRHLFFVIAYGKKLATDSKFITHFHELISIDFLVSVSVTYSQQAMWPHLDML